MRNAVAVVLLALAVSGCSWFGDDEEENTDPVKLTPIQAEVSLESIWDRRIGGGAEDHASELVPVILASRVFAASADGKVMALAEGTGRIIWQVDIRDFYSQAERAIAFADKSDAITGGVGGGGDVVVVGTFAGEIVAMNQSDGSLAWRAKTTSEVLSPPQVSGDIVVTQTIDGKVAAFDVISGERKWLYTASNPSLTLRGTSTPLVTDQLVVAAFANGRIAVLDRDRGLAGLDRRIAVAQGKSDLERLVDIDGRMVLVGPNLYVASYQGNLASVDLTNGRVRWSVEASSTAGLGEGFGNVYIAHNNGKVAAIDVLNGRDLWSTMALKFREPTTPVAVSSYLAIGDVEGYIHLIAQSDGRFVGRKKVDGDPVRSPVVVDGSRIYVTSLSGRLSVYELR